MAIINDQDLPPFTLITRHNLLAHLPTLKDLIQDANVITMDCEFSGLGEDIPGTRASNIEDRYTALRQVVQSHAMLSFGLSVWRQSESADPHARFRVHNFEFLLLSQTSYKTSSKSMRFLYENGFDFNRQVQDGIPIRLPSPKNTKNKKSKEDEDLNEAQTYYEGIQSIFNTIILSSRQRFVPVVVHNGFMDLMFLYETFHTSLPPSLHTFVADLTDLFPCGLYDTKYTSDYIDREQTSYLVYLFSKYLRLNQQSSDRRLLYQTESTLAEQPPVPVSISNYPKIICDQYAYHGHCPRGSRCSQSHDMNRILDRELGQESERKPEVHLDIADDVNTPLKRQRVDENGIYSAVAKDEMKAPASGVPTTSSHTAYLDAFMTGFVFLYQTLSQWTSLDQKQEQAQKFDSDHQKQQQEERQLKLEPYRHRLYLIGKSQPLLLKASPFYKCSPSHQQRLAQLLVSSHAANK